MQRRTLLRWLPLLGLSCTLTAGSGCVNIIANVIRSVRGDKVKPECDLLKNKKVAIVVGGERGLSNDATSMQLCLYLEERLAPNVEGIQIISKEKVDKWLNDIGREEPDYEAIGKGVGADYVLAVTLANVSLRNGQTLFKGKADISVALHDVQNGTIAFRKSMPEFEFPKLDGPSIVDTTEAKFRVNFLTIVSQHIAVLFYPYDPNDLAVQDPISMRL